MRIVEKIKNVTIKGMLCTDNGLHKNVFDVEVRIEGEDIQTVGVYLICLECGDEQEVLGEYNAYK